VFYSLLATAIIAFHFAFILFVLAGALLVQKSPKLVLLHLPAAAWGSFVELAGRICPLTPLENWCRARAGEAGYSEGFLEHYLVAVVYPAGLTRQVQVGLGVFALGLNLVLYAALVRRLRRRREAATPGGP
jgi:hypothetical protein